MPPKFMSVRQQLKQKKKAPVVRPTQKAIKAIVKKEIKKEERPKSTISKGAMKPKIQKSLQAPTRMVKMSFGGSWDAVCTSASISVPYTFRMNSINDPDLSNFSRNVRANGWQIANTLYTDYRVHKCKVTLEFANRSDYPCMFLLSANNDLSIQPATTYPTDILARAGSFGKCLTQVGGSRGIGKISKTYNLWEVEGISLDEYKDSSSTASLMTNNPTDNCFCYATLAPMAEASGNTVFGTFRIYMEFTVELLNPRDQIATAV